MDISILDRNFDIIGFTETWFNSTEDSNLVDLDNCTKLDSIRPNRTGGGASTLNIILSIELT